MVALQFGTSRIAPRVTFPTESGQLLQTSRRHEISREKVPYHGSTHLSAPAYHRVHTTIQELFRSSAQYEHNPKEGPHCFGPALSRCRVPWQGQQRAVDIRPARIPRPRLLSPPPKVTVTGPTLSDTVPLRKICRCSYPQRSDADDGAPCTAVRIGSTRALRDVELSLLPCRASSLGWPLCVTSRAFSNDKGPACPLSSRVSPASVLFDLYFGLHGVCCFRPSLLGTTSNVGPCQRAMRPLWKCRGLPAAAVQGASRVSMGG